MQKTMHILGEQFRILSVAAKLAEHGADGLCVTATNEIHIAADADSTHQGKVLLHEIFEAIKDEFKLKLSHEVLTTLATAVHCVIRDNADLMKDIAEGRRIVPLERK